jgi:hypothetical protein
MLTLDAVLRDGEWVVRRAFGSLEGCDGYEAGGADSGTFDVRAPEPIPFELSYDVHPCRAFEGLFPSRYCASGTFDWHLSGELGGVTFESSHIELRGVACGLSEDDSCDEVSPDP